MARMGASIWVKKPLIAGAEGIQPWLAVWGGDEPVFGTAAVADETDRAFAAVARQSRFFILAEFHLARVSGQGG